MTAGKSIDVDYAAAGIFVKYLLIRFGPERVRDFYRSLYSPFTLDRIAAQFQRSFGMTMDSLIDAYLNGETPCVGEFHPLPPLWCTGEPVPWDAENAWTYARSMACDADGVVGGLGEDRAWPSFRAATVAVKAGLHELEFQAAEDLHLSFGPCFGCAWEPRGQTIGGGETTQFYLEAGAYYVRVDSQSERSDDVTIALTRH